MTNRSILEKRAEKGIEWLNKTRPDWIKRIDLDKLDQGDLWYCVLGQIFGFFLDVASMPMLEGKGKMSQKLAIERGFDLNNRLSPGITYADCDLLTQIWKEKIQKLK